MVCTTKLQAELELKQVELFSSVGGPVALLWTSAMTDFFKLIVKMAAFCLLHTSSMYVSYIIFGVVEWIRLLIFRLLIVSVQHKQTFYLVFCWAELEPVL